MPQVMRRFQSRWRACALLRLFRALSGAPESEVWLRWQYVAAEDERFGEPGGEADAFPSQSIEQALDFRRIDGTPIDRLQQCSLADAGLRRLDHCFNKTLGN